MQGIRLAEGQNYKGRKHGGRTVLNFVVDTDTAELIREYAAPGRIGVFVSKAVHEYRARQEEREKRKLQVQQQG